MKKLDINENKPKTESQRKKILSHMLRGGTITDDSAREKPFYCQNLQGRIWEIRHKNHIEVKDRYVDSPSGSRYKEYYIETQQA